MLNGGPIEGAPRRPSSHVIEQVITTLRQRCVLDSNNSVRTLLDQSSTVSIASTDSPPPADLVVLSGPFRGMRYPEQSAGSELLPKLLGTYEQELHAVLDSLLRERSYSRIINIGCGEGYYAVGLALALPEAQVYAFDSDLDAQRLCAETAQLNQVDGRLIIKGICTADDLALLLASPETKEPSSKTSNPTGRTRGNKAPIGEKQSRQPETLIICDCEGAEADLLVPDLVPGLGDCDIVVEMHDPFRPGVSDAVLDAFRASGIMAGYEVTAIPALHRRPDEFPEFFGPDGFLNFLSDLERHQVLDECRPAGMQWLTFLRQSFTASSDSLTAKSSAAKATSGATGRTAKRKQSKGDSEPVVAQVNTELALQAVPVEDPGEGSGGGSTDTEPKPTPLATSPRITRITGCILARNEEGKIEDALKSLQGWTDQIIVIDNESEDRTAEVSKPYADLVLTAPRSGTGSNFDGARNMAVEYADGDWLFFLDADERVPPALGPELRKLVAERGEEFESLTIPFRNYFCGQWMRYSNWWPGYSRAQLLKKGRFRFGERLHSGPQVDGRSLFFTAEYPELAIIHYSYDDLSHFLTKLDRYTAGEAENLHADAHRHAWQSLLAHFVHDWKWYYERGRADLDGMHGFVLSFLGGAYRLLSRARLWDLRRAQGLLTGVEDDHAVPNSVAEMIAFMHHVYREGAGNWLSPQESEQSGQSGQSAESERTAITSAGNRYHLYEVPQTWLSSGVDSSTPLPTTSSPSSSLSSEQRNKDAQQKSEESKADHIERSKTGIAACIIAHNEADRIEDALRSLVGWVDRIIVVDHGSTDETAEIARRYTDVVLTAPHPDTVAQDTAAGSFVPRHLEEVRHFLAAQIHQAAFESGKNGEEVQESEESHVTDGESVGKSGGEPGIEKGCSWLLFLTPRERIPAVLGRTLADLVRDHGEDFDALCLPIRNFFYGQWMQGGVWWPGYKGPQMLKAGTIAYRSDIHSGILSTTGRVLSLPYDNQDLAVVHHVYDDIGAYLRKLNRDTSAEALAMYSRSAAGSFVSHSWQDQIADFASDWYLHYDVNHAGRDGMHGFIQSFLCAFYRFVARAKLWDLRRACGDLKQSPPDPVPASLGEMFSLMARVVAEENTHRIRPLAAVLEATGAIANVPQSVSQSAAAPESAAQPRNMANALPSSAILIQCASGSHEPLLLFTRARHAAYARRYGMEYVCRFGPQQEERSGHWDKILLLLAALRAGRYQHVFVLDADTLIVDMERDLREALPQGTAAWLGMVEHGGRPGNPHSLPGAPYFNNGVMYVRACPEALSFFERVWQTWPVHSAWEDNAAVLRVLAEDATSPRPLWTPGVVAIDDAWNSTAFQNESPRPVVSAWHGYGADAAERLLAMRAAFEAAERIEAARSYAGQERSALTGEPGEQHLHPDQPGALAPVSLPDPLRPRPNPLPVDDPAEPTDFRATLGRPLRLLWEGDQSVLSSLALVNREMCLELLAAGDVELSLRERCSPSLREFLERDPRLHPLRKLLDTPLSGPPDVVLRHQYPPDWNRPESGRLLVMQPWELSHLPDRSWLEGACNADAVLANSRYVRDIFVRSGVPAEQVLLTPEGTRADVFTPEGAVISLPTNKSIRFLFVGGALPRKGADLLLAAYRRAFSSQDDVCLVVKDMGTRTFYSGQTLAQEFQAAQAAGRRPGSREPEVLYLDADMTEQELAALYRSCHCLVAPYRGEGFCLPPLEAMACGLPVIVTSGGPSEDYLDDSMALRVPHRRVSLPGHFAHCYGAEALVDSPWWLEPDIDALVSAFHWVQDHPEEARARGRAGRAHVEAGWTWGHATGLLRQQIAAVLSAPSVGDSSAPHSLSSEATDGKVKAVPWNTAAGEVATDATTDMATDMATDAAAVDAIVDGAEVQSADRPRRGNVKGSRSGRRKTQEDVRSVTAETAENSKKGSEAAQSKLEISLCMIVRDEDARIAKCLESIRPYVDEMIIVDTGSTDRTREVARDCGARVFEMPWPNSFAAARNASLDQARGRWIFWMDADDVISEECGRGLRELIGKHPNCDAAYQVQVRIPPGPGEWSESVVDHVKLFPNRSDLRFEHRIHEQILPALRQAQIPVLPSDLYVTHAHYDRSPEGQRKKRLRDFQLLTLDLAERPNHPFVLFNLGMTHLYATKDFEVAAQYLIRCLRGSHWQDSIVRKAYALLTTARTCQQDWGLALAANEEGRRFYPDDSELLFQAGQLYQQVGRFGQARACLERLTGRGAKALLTDADKRNGEGHTEGHTETPRPPRYRSVDIGLGGYRGLHELALLLVRIGDIGEAETMLREIIQDQPMYQPAHDDLTSLLRASGRDPHGGHEGNVLEALVK